MLPRATRLGDLRCSTLSWCRRNRISACNAARDRNSAKTADQINLQKSLIRMKYQPIRRHRQPLSVCGRDSRTEIPEYADIGQAIGSAAGRINGTYGEADWTPIRYVNRAYSHSTLAGLYRAARVGLVTPLRDGMNLVAKEYVASQNPDDPGVLILSRFAGAAQECKTTLLVNPYDPDSVAAAIGQALSMPLPERRDRHNAMFQVLLRNDIQHWAGSFLAELEREPTAPSQLEQMPLVVS